VSSLHTAVAAVLDATGREVHYGKGPFEVTLPHTVWVLDEFPVPDTGGCESNVILTLEHVARDAGGVSGIAQCDAEAEAFRAALNRGHILGATGSSSLVVATDRSRVPDVDDAGVERLKTVYSFGWIDAT